ncbi:unnamed protein product [Acanthosepion pharaonis]|uniref:Uncharacterized protein n=1 Tax=Acanthosepion pharaonis TaxID=158019 RepID=A0A812BTX7_ACAPH|nr:unnamed protein product [Sepia pharaonis]
MTGKAADNTFILHCGSVNNHVPKIDYPISKGNNLKPFVKKVQLTDDYAIHVFNFNGTACISSCDLSAFLWKIDIVRTMVIICEEDYSELFSELKRINFSGLWDGEERKDWVTLFQLEDVPVVLETFNHPSAELKLAVQLAIRNFDPNDEFWRGKCKETPIENTTQSTQPLCKQSSPKPIPSRSISQKKSPTVYSEQTGLSSSASPPQFHFGKGSPSHRNELRTSSAESSPRSRRPSTVTLEDIKTINANLTHLHKLRQCILNKMEKANCPYENYAATLASVESKLQKLNALLIKASPTVENKDPPGQGRLLSPYQQNSSNARRTPSPAGNLGFSPRDTRSAFQSPSPSPISDRINGDTGNPTDDLQDVLLINTHPPFCFLGLLL